MQNINKFDKFLTDELSDLTDILIIKDRNNYILFNKYKISSSNRSVIVKTLGQYGVEHEFSSIRNAVTWCTLDNEKRYQEANRMIDLDLKLSSKDFTIQVYKKIYKNNPFETHRLIYETKLEEEELKKYHMLNELNRFIEISKNIQSQKFKSKINT
jgi:hypothetical protein